MLSIDIMFIDKLAILVGVSTPLGLTIAYSLDTADLKKPARTAAQVKIGISHFIAVLAAQNFWTSVIMSDGEGAVKSLVDELAKLEVKVDVLIRERVRCHVAYYLPFTLSTVGIAMLVLYCISRLNYEPAGLREWGPSPREAYIGRKPDGKRDFRCSFGDYVQCTVSNTDSGFKSRTVDCVVMLPPGNRTGSVRILSLSTGRLVNRDQFRVLPMPESVIKRLNELAQADGRVKGKGNLYARSTSHEQYGNATKGLPDTMEPNVNNGVDPSMESLADDREPTNGEADSGDQQQDSGGELEEQQYDNGEALNELDLRDGIELYREAIQAEQPEEHDNDMDDLVDSMNRMRAGPRDQGEDPTGGLDERGIPEDYTSTGGTRDEYSDARGAVSRATELLAVPAPHYGISRHEVMIF